MGRRSMKKVTISPIEEVHVAKERDEVRRHALDQSHKSNSSEKEAETPEPTPIAPSTVPVSALQSSRRSKAISAKKPPKSPTKANFDCEPVPLSPSKTSLVSPTKIDFKPADHSTAMPFLPPYLIEGDRAQPHSSQLKLLSQAPATSVVAPESLSKPQSDIGCTLKTEFEMQDDNQERYHCQIYKRIRLDSNNRRVHDWKLQVSLVEARVRYDYLVMRRLPCSIREVRKHVQSNLLVDIDRDLEPHLIRGLSWHIPEQGVTVHSQSYYDRST